MGYFDTWTTSQKIENAKIVYPQVSDGFKWVVSIEGELILESVRVHLSVEDARIHASHWLSKLGLSTEEINPKNKSS